jgi:hypothetical protein
MWVRGSPSSPTNDEFLQACSRPIGLPRNTHNLQSMSKCLWRRSYQVLWIHLIKEGDRVLVSVEGLSVTMRTSCHEQTPTLVANAQSTLTPPPTGIVCCTPPQGGTTARFCTIVYFDDTGRGWGIVCCMPSPSVWGAWRTLTLSLALMHTHCHVLSLRRRVRRHSFDRDSSSS